MDSEDSHSASFAIDVDFIKQDLIPEMVYNRCFCEAGSREFVEFESASVRHLSTTRRRKSCKSLLELYEVSAVVKFSGDPQQFPLLVKLDPADVQLSADLATKCFEAFQNEEMFYSKMTRCYGLKTFPKCYVSDLGSYGRPVIVLEDLRAEGYAAVKGQMDECHMTLCLQKLARFHARGMQLREQKHDIFREFYAKLLDVSFDDASMERYAQLPDRASSVLKLLADSELAAKIKEWLGESPLQTARRLATEIDDVSTICHGHFSQDNVLFKHENEKPIDAKMIDWQTMRFCSPAIDLGPVLFASSSLSAKANQLFDLYVETMRLECPTMSCVRLKENIISHLPYTYVVLSMDEDVTDSELLNILLALNELKTFE